MRLISFPPTKGYIVIESPVVLNSMTKLNIGRCVMRPKEAPEFSYKNTKIITWTLEPGEWWPIKSIWYPRICESTPYSNLPIITLNIHRSKKDRKWVREKMAKMAMTLFGTPTFNCTEFTITCSAADLNDRVVLAPDQTTALLYSKRILGQCNTSHNRNSRFTSLLLE